MDRDMKFHIYNMEHRPMCWDDKALEFDFAEDAHDFLRDVDKEMAEEAVVVKDILFYDGGYINATDLRIVDGELVKMEERYMTWEQAAIFCYNTFGTFVDWEERYFICPECQEPILEEDWDEHDFTICPVCEIVFKELD